jgi:tRNA-splicing ligase RtcB (3'-phosphate/5'-hydroxy nucleic acid ligase)
MPDIHTGFGLPIGGVMAMDAEDGLVSAGAVGMDINCGVRLLQSNLAASYFGVPELKKLITAIEKRVPSGIGQNSKHTGQISRHFNDLLIRGVPYLVSIGVGRSEDLDLLRTVAAWRAQMSAP